MMSLALEEHSWSSPSLPDSYRMMLQYLAVESFCYSLQYSLVFQCFHEGATENKNSQYPTGAVIGIVHNYKYFINISSKKNMYTTYFVECFSINGRSW